MSNLLETQESLFQQVIHTINWDSKTYFNQYEIKNLAESKSILNTGNSKKNTNNPVSIIIDNGSFNLRAGYSEFKNPSLIYKSIVAKTKITSKGIPSQTYVGEDVLKMDPGKLHKKTPFDKNLVTHFGTLEHLLDNVFQKLNITDDKVNFPIVFTEPYCNINYSRKIINEMFFELYQVPSLLLGVDCLFSAYDNNILTDSKSNNLHCKDCLIISSGYNSTLVLPIINGRPIVDKSRRIAIGGVNHNELLMKSLSLKYPEYRNKFTTEISQHIQENFTMCSIDYQKQLKLFQDIFSQEQERINREELKRLYGSMDMYYKTIGNINNKLISKNSTHSNLKTYRNMVDYNNLLLNEESEMSTVRDLIFLDWPEKKGLNISEEDLKRKHEIRIDQGKRLKEIMQKKREENLKIMEKELNELEVVCEKKELLEKEQWEELLLSKGFTCEDEFMKRIQKLSLKVNSQVSDTQNNNNPEEVDEDKKWPLLNVPDEDLSEDQIKMKRIQKMQRNAYFSRLEKREQAKREKEKIEEMKKIDPENYLVNLYRRKKTILEKLESFKQLRKDLLNRRSKVNLSRMMILAELGKENEKQKKEKTVGGDTDQFGQKDEDWDIYRGISKHNLSEDEEEEKAQLEDIEAKITEVDSNYNKFNESIYCEHYNSIFSERLYLGIDQFRGAELMFQPNLIGVDQAGLIEVIEIVLNSFSPDEKRRLVKNIFFTGGNMNYKHLKERLIQDIRPLVDINFELNVFAAQDPILDSWKGAKNYSSNCNFEKDFISKEEYLEYGPDYFKEHICSNISIGNFTSKSFKGKYI